MEVQKPRAAVGIKPGFGQSLTDMASHHHGQNDDDRRASLRQQQQQQPAAAPGGPRTTRPSERASRPD